MSVLFGPSNTTPKLLSSAIVGDSGEGGAGSVDVLDIAMPWSIWRQVFGRGSIEQAALDHMRYPRR